MNAAQRIESMQSPQIRSIRAGALTDLTSAILGMKAKGAPVLISCSPAFFHRVLGNRISGEIIRKLSMFTKDGEFSLRKSRVTLDCRCVHRKETHSGVQISCFTFFMCDEV